MYLLVLYFPLFSSFITGFFGKHLGKSGVMIINITSMVITFLVSFLIFYEVCLLKYICYINFGSWANLGAFSFNFEFLFDEITATMLFVVSLISLLVHIYSLEYMGDDPHFIRFMTYLTLFTFFMFLLVTAGNFIQLFAGWEGVGLASYLLINFWYTRTEANTSALKALFINRFGDFGLYSGIILIYFYYNSVSFFTVFSEAMLSNALYYLTISIGDLNFNLYLIDLICFFLFLGAVGKSAQLGLHVWLPDAMEGPTPVSALIHAATMVTAGIFLIIRCSPLFELSVIVLSIITLFGALTCFFAASIGLFQYDLKKVIAYSTCSQLGYMVFVCGLSQYHVGFFHLINHAFFKALLFLCAGSVIHALSNEQDIRRMGGLAKVLPITYCMMLIGSLALAGFPFLTGFYSKDVILEVAFASGTLVGFFSFFLGLFSVIFTSFYSFRILHIVYFSSVNIMRPFVHKIHESPNKMLFAFYPLAFGSIFWGYLTRDMFIGLGTDFWQNSIFILPKNYLIIDAEFIPYYIKILPFLFSVFGIFLSYIIYLFFFKKSILYFYTRFYFKHIFFFYKKIVKILNFKWYFDIFYNTIIVSFFFKLSYFLTLKNIDRGFLELFGPTGVVLLTNKMMFLTRKHFYGNISYYISMIFLFSIFYSLPILLLI